MVPSTCDDAHLLAKLARAEAPAAAVGFWGAATAPEATVELTGAAAPSDGTIEPLAAPRPDCGRGHIDGQGDQPIGVLLRPVSLPLRAADCLALQLELRLGRQLMRVGTPVSVLAVREAVRRVEGEHFARAEGEHVTVAFELLAEQVSRAPFNLAGRIYIQQLFERAARARERVYWHLACNPSVALGAVRTPIFIIGLPRTGSTHLHRLLCADPLSESLRLYEMLQPLPLAAPGSRRARLRAAYLRAQYRAMDLLAPGYIAANSTFHRADMDGPEEEAVLLAGCGVSMMPYVCVGGAGSAYEAAHADGRTKAAAFRYLRRFLQLVAGARQAASNSRWVLKSHYNALWADALLAEFPDAKLIITVREPLEVVQSFISYSIANLSFVADGASGEELARSHAAAAYRYMLSNARALVALQRRLRGSRSLYVVKYKRLVAEPIGVLREVYAQFDIPLTDEALATALAYLRESPQHGLGRPTKVAVREVGLSVEQITRDFADYCVELGDGAQAFFEPK